MTDQSVIIVISAGLSRGFLDPSPLLLRTSMGLVKDPSEFRKSVSLFGRILKITDVDDAITSPRVYRSTACSPDQALTILLKGAATEFDPLLLKSFATLMGSYPLGTLLEFDTGEIGLVARYPRESGSPYPEVLLLKQDDVGTFQAGDMVELEPTDPHRGASLRRVVRTLNPGAYGIQPADFLVQDPGGR